MDQLNTLAYDPGVFDVDSVEAAKAIILTPDGRHTPEQRWDKETGYLLEIIEAWLPLRGATCLDFGCGIGRLSKPLIERRGWSVIGVDISPSMRRLATGYVDSPDFLACDPRACDRLLRFGARCDFALAVWALQHAQNVQEDVARLAAALNPGGRLFVLNATQRFLPTRQAWVNDNVDVVALLNAALVPIQMQVADKDVVPAPPAFWGVYERPA